MERETLHGKIHTCTCRDRLEGMRLQPSFLVGCRRDLRAVQLGLAAAEAAARLDLPR